MAVVISYYSTLSTLSTPAADHFRSCALMRCIRRHHGVALTRTRARSSRCPIMGSPPRKVSPGWQLTEKNPPRPEAARRPPGGHYAVLSFFLLRLGLLSPDTHNTHSLTIDNTHKDIMFYSYQLNTIASRIKHRTQRPTVSSPMWRVFTPRRCSMEPYALVRGRRGEGGDESSWGGAWQEMERWNSKSLVNVISVLLSGNACTIGLCRSAGVTILLCQIFPNYIYEIWRKLWLDYLRNEQNS